MKNLTKELVLGYYNDEHTFNECAEYFNISQKKLSRLFRIWGIKKRSKSETNIILNKRKRAEKLLSYNYIDKESFKEFYYIETNEEIIERFNIKSHGDLLFLVDCWGLPHKTYADRQTIIQNHLLKTKGVINVFQLPEVVEKIQTKLANKSPEERKEITNKIKQTKLDRYDDENYTNSAKAKQTILDNYGSFENYNNARKEAAIITNNKKYGKDWYMQTDEYKDSYRKTCNEKYNVDYFCQSSEYIKTGRKKYLYNNIYFDSSWELALYIYAINHNEEIIRSPISLEYEFEGKKHYYFPDFLYKNKLIEIKGDHLLDDNGNLVDGYNSNLPVGLLLAKQKCIEENNVEI